MGCRRVPGRVSTLGMRLLLFALGLAHVAASAQAAVEVRASAGRVTVMSPATGSAVIVTRPHFRLRIARPGNRRLLGEDRRGGLFYERADGIPHRLERVTAVQPLPDGAALQVTTDEGANATVTLRWVADGTLSVVFEPPDPPTVVALGERLRSPQREAIYGLTERLRDSPPILDTVIDIPQDDIKPPEVGSLDRRGETVAMFVRPTFALYAPFFVSSRGYGLAVAGTAPGLFDLAHTDPTVLRFRFETGRLPAHQRLAFDVFIGPTYPEILDAYTSQNGRPIVPPAWAFGHWRWRDELAVGNTAALDGISVQGQAAEDVLKYEELGLSAGIFVFDRPSLQGEFGFARFAWDEQRLPHQSSLLQSLQQRGWRTVNWSSMWTCGSEAGDNGLAAQALQYHVPGPVGPPHCADIGGQSFILDVTNAAARSWWADRLGTWLTSAGLVGVKLDRGEEHIPSLPTDLWADGRSGREARNAYPTLQAQVHHQALQQARPNGDFVLLTRSGYTGTAQFAIAWGGDIPGSEGFGTGSGTDLGLRSAIIAQQRAAFMGYPIWGSDTGGYYEFRDGTVDGRPIRGREVFARWLEFSAFSGIMEIGGKGNHAPWDMPTAPQNDIELTAIYAKYIKLRTALQDYIVAAAADGARGLPIVRPMPFYDANDPRLRDRWDQYLFGPDLMVAPVWKSGAREREVYFPTGRWRNYWDPADVVQGPTTATIAAPLDVIPVWVRGTAVVPPPPS